MGVGAGHTLAGEGMVSDNQHMTWVVDACSSKAHGHEGGRKGGVSLHMDSVYGWDYKLTSALEWHLQYEQGFERLHRKVSFHPPPQQPCFEIRVDVYSSELVHRRCLRMIITYLTLNASHSSGTPTAGASKR